MPGGGLRGVWIIRVRDRKGRVRTGSSQDRPKLRLLGEPFLQWCRIGEEGGRNRMQRKKKK